MEKQEYIRALANQFYQNLAQPDPVYLAQLRKLSPQDIPLLQEELAKLPPQSAVALEEQVMAMGKMLEWVGQGLDQVEENTDKLKQKIKKHLSETYRKAG
jgi:uncharacterized protein Yka (UPF0111/DUF47 family)